jgi:nucleoside-diphosphate-sugar epimerase
MAKVALIFGATGIVGSALTEQLSRTSAQEWKKIIITSRRKPVLETNDARIQFVSIDLTDEAQVKEKLLGAGAADTTHMFFTAYIHSKSWDGKELCEKNIPIFKNALKVVDSIAPNLERVVLQTGTKYYGVHLGPLKNPPVSEAHGRHPDVPENPDYYFGQEDYLVEMQKGKKWKYTTDRPNIILGVTRGNGMSIVPTLALYFLVQKELGNKAAFPGGERTYKGICDTSNAELIAQFLIFAATNKQAENEHFNIIDNNDVHETWEQQWKMLANYFGVEVEEPTFTTAKLGPAFSLEKYMADKQNVWKQVVKKRGGDEELWKFATWDFADALFSMSWDNGPFDLTKALSIGWNKQITPTESYTQVLNKLKKFKFIPQ